MKNVKLAHRAREQVLAALGDIVKHGPDAFGATQVHRLRSENFNRSRNEEPNATTVDRCKRCFSASHKYGPDCEVPDWSTPSLLEFPPIQCRFCFIYGHYGYECRVCTSCGRWGHLAEVCGANFPPQTKR